MDRTSEEFAGAAAMLAVAANRNLKWIVIWQSASCALLALILWRVW